MRDGGWGMRDGRRVANTTLSKPRMCELSIGKRPRTRRGNRWGTAGELLTALAVCPCSDTVDPFFASIRTLADEPNLEDTRCLLRSIASTSSRLLIIAGGVSRRRHPQLPNTLRHFKHLVMHRRLTGPTNAQHILLDQLQLLTARRSAVVLDCNEVL